MSFDVLGGMIGYVQWDEQLVAPEVGPIDPDARRVVMFEGVATIERTLRDDDADPYCPLNSIDAVGAFVATVPQAEGMYGWSLIDVSDPSDQWNVDPSLQLPGVGDYGGDHTLRCFTECGRPGPDGSWERYFLQGVIYFEGLRVERANAEPMPLHDFVMDARRRRIAFGGGDVRLSSQAQPRGRDDAITWRSWSGG